MNIKNGFFIIIVYVKLIHHLEMTMVLRCTLVLSTHHILKTMKLSENFKRMDIGLGW